MSPERAPIVGVSVSLWDEGRVLLLRRAGEPYAGLWSFAGGKVRHGERMADAALRELREETGLSANIGDIIATLDVIGPPGGTPDPARYHFVLVVLEATHPSGDLSASDDASAAGWFTLNEALALALTPETAMLLERKTPAPGR